MNTFQRIARLAASERIAGILFAAASLVTLTVLAFPRGGSAAPSVTPHIGTPQISPPSVMKISGTLSQTKLVQGGDGLVYLEVNVDPPAPTASLAQRKPVDLVVVLDHSGSMAVENRLPYAKAAITDLLGRLSEQDRFGLVTFESGTRILTPLAPVTSEFRNSQQLVVRAIQPAGSTNLSGGLELGESMLKVSASGRTKKIILLSDGEANVGIIDPSGLGAIARRVSGSGSILSTIGMGLDFNESLMASLADHGMGNYSYLENLESLGVILAKDLNDSRSVYASASGLEIKLPAGATLVDSSGYPQEPAGDAIRLLTGQVLAGVRKSIFLTISTPTQSLGSVDFGRVVFNYTADGTPGSVTLDSRLAMEIVPPSEKEKAVASIEQGLFKKGWAQNALGRMQQDFGREMKAGNVTAANMVMDSYRRRAQEAEAASGVKVFDEKANSKLSEMAISVSDLVAAPASEQKTKAARAAKQYQFEGLQGARSN